jgi:FkbM family methyltransferase
MIRSIILDFQKHTRPSLACKIQNIIQSLKGRHTRYYFNDKNSLFYINENSLIHHFAELERGIDLYHSGIKIRSLTLYRSYLLDRIEFLESDVIIDCGANYADLYVELMGKIAPENYISFEPGKDEFKCIQQNAVGGQNFNLGLSNKEGAQSLYVSSAGADSSLIEPKTYSGVVEVQTTTLDSLVERLGLTRIKLLKLEAEGFEPEILDGAENFLSICEYVAIDGSDERGVNEEETFSTQANFLYARGFVLDGVNLKWGRALFRKAR